MDRLDRLEGMTSGMAHDLNQAGILTYADLAALPPERLSAIVNPTPHHDGQGSRAITVEDWITQAQALADHLRHGATPPAP
jgi:predicted flap endonuclease-1-like 5' DNA nuclease